MEEAQKNKVKELLHQFIDKYPDGYTLEEPYEINDEEFTKAFNAYYEAASKGVKDNTPIVNRLYDEISTKFIDDRDEQLENEFFSCLSFEDKQLVKEYLDEECTTIDSLLYEEGYAGTFYDIEIEPIEINLMFDTPCAINQDRCSIPSTLRDMVEGYSENLSDYVERLNKEPESEQAKHFDNALTYLVHQQGYTMAEFAAVFYGDKESDSKFLNSLADAYTETTSSRAELAISIELSKNDLPLIEKLTDAEAANDKDFWKNFFKPSHNDMESLTQNAAEVLIFPPAKGIFFHDRDAGAGSGLEIELEKPLQIPLEMLNFVQIENIRKGGYTVNQVYDGAYREATISIEPAGDLAQTVVKESTEDIVKALSQIEERLKAKEDIEYRAEAAARFISSEGLELEPVSKNDFMLFDTEVQDYRRDDDNHPMHFSSFEDIIINLDTRVQERLMDLDDNADDFQEFSEKGVPLDAKEWAKYFEENIKSEFSRVYSNELAIIDTIAFPEKVDMELVCKELDVKIPEAPEKKRKNVIDEIDNR